MDFYVPRFFSFIQDLMPFCNELHKWGWLAACVAWKEKPDSEIGSVVYGFTEIVNSLTSAEAELKISTKANREKTQRNLNKYHKNKAATERQNLFLHNISAREQSSAAPVHYEQY